MKKFFLLTIISALVLGVSSCKSDDDEDHALVGTAWVFGFTESDGFEWSQTIYFTSATEGYMDEYRNDDEEATMDFFTYTYSHPTVTFNVDGNIAIAIVNGNTLTFPDEEGDTDWDVVYTKK